MMLATVCTPLETSQPPQADCFGIMLQSASQHNPCSSSATLLSGGGAELVGRVATIFGPHEGEDLPQIIRGLDDCTEGGHGADHVFVAFAHVSGLLQLIAAQGHETEQRVVVAAVHPCVIC